MESQLQQPKYDDTTSQKATAALEPALLSKLSPSPQIQEKWWWQIGTQVPVWLAGLPESLDRLFNQYNQAIINVALILAFSLAARVILAVMDALNDIPLLEPTFELVGIGYCVWFFYRYLLWASTRQELFQEIQGLLNQQGKDVIRTSESKQLYKLSEIVPTSSQSSVINQDRGSSKQEITSTNGEHFPPSPEPGMHYQLVDETKHKGNQGLLGQQGNDVIRTSESKQLYKPGEIVSQSGQYELINVDGGSSEREITATKGEPFPPTPESGK